MAGRRRRNRADYYDVYGRYRKKEHTPCGVISVILGVFSVGMIPVMITAAYQAGGNAGVPQAAQCASALLLAILGILLSAGEAGRENINRTIPRTGIVLCAAALILWLIIILIGLI